MNRKFTGRLDFDEKTGKLASVEVFFEDEDYSPKESEDEIRQAMGIQFPTGNKQVTDYANDLATKMLKASFGSNFDPMFNESIADYPI